eukprot:TRINITY_DN3405_c0_g1_i1.p2 TRINITY_DN3405_c0_g1~~TRINITY_DN3405_c0_g1_i1.p2  ORF type:complete len:353 (-),score=161.24 TRINITY_DN3405_c0_g1_i1:114-1172(-)
MSSLDGILVGLGNPLLDISANVTSDLVSKYELKLDNAILAEAKHLPLYEELVATQQVEYFAGGATQNSMRAAQWMLGVPGAVSYIGSVGDDQYGRQLAKAASDYGLTTHYNVQKDAPTGTCAVLVVDRERSLVANLGAAEKYSKSHFDSAEVQAVLAKASYFYQESYFLTHSPEVSLALAQYASRTRKYFALNVSAVFLVEVDFFWQRMAALLPHADLIVANELEATALGLRLGLPQGSSLADVAAHVASLPKENGARGRTVIFTQGASATIVCRDGRLYEFKPVLCPRERLIDTNGAGDSFVGGFLSGLVRRASLEECINAAHYCAYECIQQSGCAFPPRPRAAGPFFLAE